MNESGAEDTAEDAAWAAVVAGGFGDVRAQLGIASDAEAVEYLAGNYSNEVLEASIDAIHERPEWLRKRERDPLPEELIWAQTVPLLRAAVKSDVNPDRPSLDTHAIAEPPARAADDREASSATRADVRVWRRHAAPSDASSAADRFGQPPFTLG